MPYNSSFVRKLPVSSELVVAVKKMQGANHGSSTFTPTETGDSFVESLREGNSTNNHFCV